MALALYRKYRPRTFAEVIGQEHVTEPLSQALRSGRLNHAYLFSGPRGCGKTSSARILARSLNCEQGPTPDPCGVCASCRSLANDGAGSIDVIEIDAASHGGVDDARELREKAFFAPANSRYKIYVIDEAHMVSSAGFNALLKLVEEPPDYVKFIFATTEPDKVLGTIRSRTHHYPFRLIPPATLRPYLQQLTETEGVKVDPAVFPLVVRAGGGSARDTLSVLDQLIAGAGPEGVSYSRAVALLGVTDSALIDQMCDALAAGDGAAAYGTIDNVAEAGHDPRRFASDLLERLRDLIVLQQVPDAVAKGLIDGPADQLEAMAGQAARLGPATLSRAADIVHNGLVEMRGTTAPRLLLELITARMLLPGAEDSTGSLLQRLERLERGIPSGVRVEHASPAAPEDDGSYAAPQVGEGEPSSAVAVGGSAAAVGGSAAAEGGPAAAGGGGKAAAMAAAAAAARRASGPPARSGSSATAPAAADLAGPGTAAPVSPAAAPTVAPVSAAPVSPAAAPAVAPVSPAPAPVSTARTSPASASPGSDPSGSVPGAASVSSAPTAPVSAAPVAPVSAEPDWNAVADGGYDEEPPPWDDEPAEPPAPDPAEQVAELERKVRAAWLDLGRRDKTVGLMQGSGIDLRTVESGTTVVFGAPNPRYAERFLTYRDLITEAFGQALGGQWQIRCDVGEPPAAPAQSREGRPQPAAQRPPSGGSNRPAAAAPAVSPAAAAPERNTGRTEPRPSRPQPSSSADSDDDWPEPAQPAPSDPQGSPEAARRENRPGRPETAHEESRQGRPEAARQESGDGHLVPERSARSASEDRRGSSAGPDDDTGWPEPARPGSAAHTPVAVQAAPSVSADDDWPEPVRPGGRAAGSVAESLTNNQPGVSAAGSHQDSSGPRQDASVSSADPASRFEQANGAAAGSGHGLGGSAPGAGHGPGGPAAGSGHRLGGSASGSGAGLGGSPAQPSAVTGAPASPPGAGSAGAASRPAFGGAAVPVRPGSDAPSAAASAGAAGSASASASASAAPARPGVPVRSAAMEAARAAARGGGIAATGAGPAAARAAVANARNATPSRSGPDQGNAGGSSYSDVPPIQEAPYDPEYDGPPPGGAAAYEGFDPGDEPLDEVIDEKTARQSSEEQAMQLLRDAFGAEKIAEI
ncbi:DNA polymerase III subunit gamma and tau [Actinoplanes sp. NBC_00393]|uniref:DNA polymerase III subunit gamma and tau n=1 Tax=Actinoplanes sp. NBC_00393 TaxID=2975953 RepID=UPI002E1B3805